MQRRFVPSLTALKRPDSKSRCFPRLIEIIDGRVGVGDIREATIADLLQSDESELHDESILDFIRGRRVLVTGAGGSIGSELCRQLMQYEPGELHMLDRDESALQAVQLSIDGQGQLSSRKLVLTDMRDADAVERLSSASLHRSCFTPPPLNTFRCSSSTRVRHQDQCSRH